MVARFPGPAFEYRELQRYQPQLSAPVAWFGAIQFAVLLNCVALFLWNADRMPLSQSTVWLAALAAENMVLQHQVFKPLAMALAMVAVAKASGPGAASRPRLLLLAALACSLVGDSFLMFPGFFIPGLVSFLIAHLFYIALFKHGLPWFPNRLAFAATLGTGGAMRCWPSTSSRCRCRWRSSGCLPPTTRRRS